MDELLEAKRLAARVHLAAWLRRIRLERGLSLRGAAAKIGVTKETLSDLERARRDPHPPTLAKIAEGYGVEISDLLGPMVEEESLLASPKDEAPQEPGQIGTPAGAHGEVAEEAAEPLSPKLRRHAAWVRRARLEGMLKHLTLRVETLRDQAKMHYEAGDPDELRSLFLDSMFLAEGAESLLAESREEAEKLGSETPEERHLRDRLEHRTEDLDEVNDKIGDMWKELQDAEREAEREAPDHDDVPYIFRRKRAG